MSHVKNQRKISPEEFKLLLHPTEDSRFDLALFIVIPVVGLGLLFLLKTTAFVFVFIGAVALFIWFTMELLKAHLTANAVKVSQHNFPEIYEVLQDVKYVLDYQKDIQVYVVEEGTVNAFLSKFFRTELIVLNSELVEDMIEQNKLLQAKWVIARFIGSLKAKHTRIFFVRVIINSLEKLQIFNLFLLPYERAIQYSGDQIGLAVCKDLDQSLTAFYKFMVGNQLSHRVNPIGIMEQEKEMNIFASIARLFSTHPHVVDRFANLITFAERQFPLMHAAYMRKQRREHNSDALY